MSARAVLAAVLALGVLAVPTPSAAAPAPVPLEVTGATYAEFDARTGTWLLRGRPVVVVRGATRIEAAEIVYSEPRGVVRATGGVIIRHDTLTLQAAAAEGRLRDETVTASGAVVVTVPRDGGLVRLRAARVEADLRRRRLLATGQPILAAGEASLQAGRLEYDAAAQAVTASGGTELVVPEGRLRAGSIRALLDRDQAEASGDVRLLAGEVSGESPRATLDRAAGLAVLSGGAVVRRGSDVLSAEQITIDLRARKMVATGSPRLVIGEPGR